MPGWDNVKSTMKRQGVGCKRKETNRPRCRSMDVYGVVVVFAMQSRFAEEVGKATLGCVAKLGTCLREGAGAEGSIGTGLNSENPPADEHPRHLAGYTTIRSCDRLLLALYLALQADPTLILSSQ